MYCQQNGIVIQAYCPIVRNQKADDKQLVSIAEKHAVSPNQILVRWSIQRGFVSLPKSDNPDRITTNGDVYGFTLDEDDMRVLDGCDQGPDGALVFAVQNS